MKTFVMDFTDNGFPIDGKSILIDWNPWELNPGWLSLFWIFFYLVLFFKMLLMSTYFSKCVSIMKYE